MQFSHRGLVNAVARRAAVAIIGISALLGLVMPARAAERQRTRVEDYVIHATITPVSHKIVATAKVRFVALDDITYASFELHNALRPTKVVTDDGKELNAERYSQDGTIRIALPEGMSKGQTKTLTIEYEGILQSVDDSPVPGLKLAYLGDPASYLLYPGRWFPMNGYGIDRFTAEMHITVPEGYTVIGSGPERPGVSAKIRTDVEEPAPAAKPEAPRLQRRGAAAQKKQAAATKPDIEPPTISGGRTYTFRWTKPSFPGSIFIGKYTDTPVNEGGLNVHVYFLPDRAGMAQQYGETAVKEFSYFTTLYGPALSTRLNIVQMPDDTVPATWAPEIAAVAGRALGGKLNYRLLANTVAHQWFGVDISPSSRNSWWIQDGGARYSEARYIEFAAGRAGEEEAVKDMSVGALAYESAPLAQIGTLDPFDPVFQSLVTDKGGILFHMLRWTMGEMKFDQMMREFMKEYAGKPVSSGEFAKVASSVQGEPMSWYFDQWLNSTGAPEFKNKYTIFRTNKGFRVVGHISQDLDLFRMPVQLKIDTDGKSEMKTIEVVGTDSPYQVETFGKPRRITIDPNNWVLKNSPELRLRTAIMRGQQLVQQGNYAESLREFQKALDVNRNSSLAHYRIAEVFYQQRNYQAAANSYRDCLNGDGDPKWTEVWSHIQLGKIYDITGQRERALNEYRMALQTNDNTQGALDEARKYLQAPFQRPDNFSNGQ